jgi:spore maturation protein CgeB
MRLLVSGSLRNTNTIGYFITRNFDASVEYELLKYPDVFASLMQKKIYRVIYRLFPIWVVRKMDKLFLRQVAAFKPDVVLIFKGMEISNWSLKKVKASGVKLVNYNFDHPFIHFSRGTGNRFVVEAIPYYDLHISYSSFIAAALSEKYNVNTAWIPFGFHLTDTQYREVLNENRPEINRVCFVGNPDHLRIGILKKLLNENIAIDLYGFDWEKFLEPHKMLTIHPPRMAGSFWSDPVEFWKVLRQYRVQLNFFRPHNEGSHNLRTFEVPSVGGILLTPDSYEQGIFFESGKEIFTYTNFENLLERCRWLLSRDKIWTDEIRIKARSRSMAADYSYKRRTQDLLLLLKQVVNTHKI